MNTVYIYGLVDPTSGKVRYVGKSKNPKYRLSVHMNWYLSRTSAKSKWIHGLIKQHLKPSILILQEVSESESATAEAKWISLYKNNDLVNSNDGGVGYDSKKHKLQKYNYR